MMTNIKSNIKRLLGYSLVLGALLFVFTLYTNPDLYVTVSTLFWSCFGAI